MPVPDSTSLKLIRLLQDNPRATYAELARESGISLSTVRRRVEQLQASEVINYSLIADVWQLGYRALSLVAIKADLAHIDDIAETLRQMEEVTMVLVTLGRFDIFVGIALWDVDQVYPFLKERVAPIPGIRDFETFLSAAPVKIFQEWRIPAADLGGRPE